MTVKRPRGDAGRLGKTVNTGTVKALFAKAPDDGLENAPPRLFLVFIRISHQPYYITIDIQLQQRTERDGKIYITIALFSLAIIGNVRYL